MDKGKKADYKGFGEHVAEYEEQGIPVGVSDLRRLARRYNTSIPKLSESGELEWPDETK